MRTKKNLFPGGKNKALTMSYDDGVTQDRKLVEIFDHYGIRGTFNLNGGFLGQKDNYTKNGKTVCHFHIEAKEVRSLYKNHEVAVHTLTHPYLKQLPREIIYYEVVEDKKILEELTGYPIRGMAYPFGSFDTIVKEVLRELGIEYSRSVVSHMSFELPEDYHEWAATCHHNNKELMNMAEKFVDLDEKSDLALLYIWGHSYEFDYNDNWQIIEEFCKLTGKREDIWYATNIEISDYLKAVELLKFSATGSSVYNPTGLDVWISVDGKTFKIEKGDTVKLI